MPSNCRGIARTATGLDEKVEGDHRDQLKKGAAGGPDLGSLPRARAGPPVGRVSWQQQKRLVIMGPAGPRPDGFVNSSNFSPPRKEKEFALPASLLRCHLIVAVTLDTAHFFHLCFKTNPYLLKFINYTQT